MKKQEMFTFNKMIMMNKTLQLLVNSLLIFICAACSDEEDGRIFGDKFEYEAGDLLFSEAVVNVALTEEMADIEVKYAAGHKVTLCWITSQEVTEKNCFHEKDYGLKILTGDIYVAGRFVEDYLSGEIVSDQLAYRDSYIMPCISNPDWSDTGVEIIDTHANKDISYDNCEFVYRGWLQVTLGGEDEEHRFIRLRSVAEAPEGYETARLYFNPAYKFVNNMITVTQRGYAPSE